MTATGRQENIPRTRILLVTRNFPPLVGGMERLMQQAAAGMAAYADLTIIGPTGTATYVPPGTRVLEAPPGILGFLLLSSWHVLRVCRKNSYDLVLGGSGLVAPLLRLASKLSGARSVVFVHGLDLVVNNRLYQAIFAPSVGKADLVIANSKNTMQLAMDKGVRAEQVCVINPGTSVPGSEAMESAQDFRQRHDLLETRIVLFVGRLTQRKGLSRFIESGLPQLLAEEPGTCLLVAGDNPDQGLTSQGEQEAVHKAVKSTGLEQQVRFLNRVSDEELAACYSAADVQVFPLVEVPGDVEGFGMVAIEAAAHGTPTVAFSTGGVADAISPDSGVLVAPGHYDLLTEAIVNILRSNQPDSSQCRKHAATYHWDVFNQKLREQLESLG